MGKDRLPKLPALCVRKDGRLYCTDPHLKKQIYFKSIDEYEAWRSDFLQRFRTVSPPPEPMQLVPGQRVTVAKLCAAYLDHARLWYRKDGEPTSEVGIIESMVRRLDAVAGDTRVDRLRAADIENFLQQCIEDDLSRRTINALLRKLKTMAKWAVRKESMSGEVLGRILAVTALSRGRTAAREKPLVKPVPLELVEATLPYLPKQYQALVQVQLWSGMRPGEAIRLRAVEIDRSRKPWEYAPERYKTEHRHEDGDEHRRRRIYFGPKCRALLQPYLDAAADETAPLFRSQRGKVVTGNVYRFMVGQACERGGLPHWHPSQLRHTTATAIRARYGIEAASNVLGHEDLDTTRIYAEKASEQARRIVEEMG